VSESRKRELVEPWVCRRAVVRCSLCSRWRSRPLATSSLASPSSRDKPVVIQQPMLYDAIGCSQRLSLWLIGTKIRKKRDLDKKNVKKRLLHLCQFSAQSLKRQWTAVQYVGNRPTYVVCFTRNHPRLNRPRQPADARQCQCRKLVRWWLVLTIHLSIPLSRAYNHAWCNSRKTSSCLCFWFRFSARNKIVTKKIIEPCPRLSTVRG